MGISLGLVGLGEFGSSFAELFKNHPLVDRVALCDREPERMEAFASRESWKDKLNRRDIYTSLDDICRSNLDALVIITQPWLHAPQCIKAMESGKHVYSAVPVIHLPDGDEILDWCDRLVRTSQKTGMRYMLGETTYFRPEAMYCRRQAALGAFGDFVYTEGEYFHDVDEPTSNLRDVTAFRLASKAGQEWLTLEQQYIRRGFKGGPMHYPTHSVGGPVCVMKAHALRVCAWGFQDRTHDSYFKNEAFANETGFYYMSNGSTMRICEHRQTGLPGRETFRIYGTKGAFEDGRWLTTKQSQDLTDEQMRDTLPPEVAAAFAKALPGKNFYGGHGGSHAYLVHEFVEAVAKGRQPAVNVHEAVRYMAAGVMAHKSALKGGEILEVPDWGNAVE